MKQLKVIALTPLLTISIAVVCLPSLAHANLIINGSFEDPGIGPGTWQVYDGTSASIPGWTVTFGSGIEVQHNVVGAPFHGDQLVELDSYGNSGMQQVIVTDPGVYSLQFEYAPRPWVAAESTGIEVYFNGSLLDSIAADGSNNGETAWTTHAYLLTAGATTTIEFRAAGNSDLYGGYLDNVRLTAVVPEPTHAASLAGLGLGVLALVRRLRRRS